MFVEIGRRDRSVDLVDLLFECHHRIRAFSRLAVELGTREGLSVEDIVAECRRCERYFGESLPLHVEDEERSVVPRLKGRRPDLDEAMAAMHEQHGDHEAQLAALLDALRAVRAAPTDAGPRAVLRTVGQALAWDLEEHLRLEEDIIFPAIRTLLSAEERGLIVKELRARRG